jgi:hypothetical protein
VILIAGGAAVLAGVGATLVFSQLGRLSRPSLAERLKPFGPGGSRRPSISTGFGGGSLRRVAAPLLREYGDRLSKLAGITEPLDRRLSRLHSPLEADAFRLRQVAWCLTALIAAAAFAAAAPVPPVVKPLVVAGAPILAFLVVEQRLVRATDRWRRDVSLEMPVIAEQLAMLLNAGYSLGSAIARLAERGAVSSRSTSG